MKRRSYFAVKVSNVFLRKQDGTLLSFRSLERAFEFALEYLNRHGKTHYSFTKNVKFVVNNGKYDSELSYACVKDFAMDMEWLKPQKEVKDGSFSRKR